jgi:hypothetical protein
MELLKRGNQSKADIAELVEYGEADAWGNYYLASPLYFSREYRVIVKQFTSIWTALACLDQVHNII